jgi:DNA repair photolyase
MSQWEHHKIDLNNVPRKTDDIDLLNDAGDQGWELVTITTNSMAYFKRQLEDPAPVPAARRKAATSRASGA